MRAHGLTPPWPMLETDMVGLKLDLMRDSLYLSFHAVGHLRSSGVPEIRPVPLADARWMRSAGIITRRGVEPNPAAVHLADIIEEICRYHDTGASPRQPAALPSLA